MDQNYGGDCVEVSRINNEILAFRITDAARRMACATSSCPKCFEPHEIGSSRWFRSLDNIHGLPASSPLQAIFDSEQNATRTTQLSTEAIMAHCDDLRQKLNQMHKIVITSLSTNREQKTKCCLPQEPMQTSLWEIFWLPLPRR